MKLCYCKQLPSAPTTAGLIQRLGKVRMGRDAVRCALGSHPAAGEGDFPRGLERRLGLKTPDRRFREPLRVAGVRCLPRTGGRSQPPPAPGAGFPRAEPSTHYSEFWTEACCNKRFATLCPQPKLCKSSPPRRRGESRTASDPGKAETASGARVPASTCLK